MSDFAEIVTDLQNALVAVQAALDKVNTPVETQADPTWDAIKSALESNGWTAPVPSDPAA